MLLCTTQGPIVQQYGEGTKNLFKDAGGVFGGKFWHWRDAKTSSHKVEGSQLETERERGGALKSGKAVSEVIGIKTNKTNFDVPTTIQVTLK